MREAVGGNQRGDDTRQLTFAVVDGFWSQVLPFFLDFTVGFSSIIIACNWTRDAQMWGAMILWVA